VDYQNRQALVRRIASCKISGSIEYCNFEHSITIEDPSIDLLLQADVLYFNRLSELNSSKAYLNNKDTDRLLISRGLWSKDKASELARLRKDLNNLNSRYPTLKFKKAEQTAILVAIDVVKKRISELESITDQLWSATSEGTADRIKKRFIVANITSFSEKTNSTKNLLSVPSFLDKLIVSYYRDKGISQKDIRELARTDPWRTSWLLSKDTGTPLFSRITSDLTELQQQLVTWTRIYDFAYNSQSRPTEDIIDDDDKFDAWYKGECEKIDKENKNNYLSSGVNNGNGGNETYVMADKEGAKEVYDINSYESRRRIAMREKAIEKKGSINEEYLPDIQADLRMEAIKNGGKR